MTTHRTVAELGAALAPLRAADRIGLVPTMGALHGGHRALLEAARSECDVVVASIFVNPAQFGPEEDFERYPRDEAGDARRAEAWGVDHLFVPPVDELYPDGFQTWVEVEELGSGPEGKARPGHFRAVATICLKLFNIVRPQRAYFGEKDAEQAAVVERLVRDLHVPVEVRVLPTVRDDDGLALSSRNVYLSAEEREAARTLPRALRAGAEAHRRGGDAPAAARAVLADEHRLDPDYVDVARLNGRTYLLAAVRAGRTRLIDNVVLEGDTQ
ncbi:MAG TPA: pantoate--beta-alanine ligase [Gaiellaceae bacterium]|nr:pantoate--beta-alanine ligase [Gaiellaceae bacterium]